MLDNTMLFALISDIQTDIEYLKRITRRLQEAVEELKEINDKEEEDE